MEQHDEAWNHRQSLRAFEAETPAFVDRNERKDNLSPRTSRHRGPQNEQRFQPRSETVMEERAQRRA